jgi:antimicrobial peptide system SdpB family protein
VRSLIQRLYAAADAFEPRTAPLAISRTLLAVAELTAVVASSDHELFVTTPSASDGMRCTGMRGLSVWCLAGSSPHGMLISRIVTVVVLLVVISGYRPRWSCVPHWYVAFSLADSITQPDGGDAVAAITTMLFVPLLIGDDRVWHWSRPAGELAPFTRGSAYAAWLALRCQTAVIYLNAAIAKLAVPQWRDGQAMSTVFADPVYGAPRWEYSHFATVLQNKPVVAAVTWGTIGTELAIAVCALLGRRARRRALVAAVLLHGAIVVAMGLFSFGLVMIALVMALCVDSPAGGTAARTAGGTVDSAVRIERPISSRHTVTLETLERP